MRSSEANKGRRSLTVNVTEGTYFAATLIQEYEDRFLQKTAGRSPVRGQPPESFVSVFSAGGNNA